jgi:hypothetical protein
MARCLLTTETAVVAEEQLPIADRLKPVGLGTGAAE